MPTSRVTRSAVARGLRDILGFGHREPIFYADILDDYPKIGGVGEYSVRLNKVLRDRYGDRLISLRSIERELGPFEGTLDYLQRERLALQRLAVAHPGAIVIVPNFQSPVPTNAPSRLRIVNVVHDVTHGNYPADLWNPHHSLVDRMYYETVANADHIAFISEATRRDFCARYGAPRSHSIVGPCMSGEAAAPRKARENYLLAVAYFEFHEHKNFEGVIRLFTTLARRDPDLRLVLTGRGRDLFEAALETIAPEDVRARIEHRGYVPKAELHDLYAGARAFVSLSRFEGFDMPSAEAALHGVPLIVSDLAVRHELFGDSACIVDALDPCIDTVASFLAQPRAPRPRLAHTTPGAIARTVARTVRKLETMPSPHRVRQAWMTAAWKTTVWPVTAPARHERLALLASTIAASALFISYFSTSVRAENSPPLVVINDLNVQGGYYNAPAPDVVSTQHLGEDRRRAIVTGMVLGSVLKGYHEQINCTDCITGFGSAGSFSFGLHGRKQLTQDLSIIGGVGFAEYRAGGVHVTSAPILAGLFRYDLTELGASRPFFEVGGLLSPGQRVTSTRVYGAGLTPAVGRGTTSVTSGSVFGRVGWVTRLTPQDEAAVAIELAHGWQRFGGYTEALTPANLVPMATQGGTDRIGIVKFGGQWTHLWGTRIETQANLGVARSFGSASSLAPQFSIGTFGPVQLREVTWAEYGARVGFRVQPNFVIDVFTEGTLSGSRQIGNTIHGGVAARYSF